MAVYGESGSRKDRKSGKKKMTDDRLQLIEEKLRGVIEAFC